MILAGCPRNLTSHTTHHHPIPSYLPHRGFMNPKKPVGKPKISCLMSHTRLWEQLVCMKCAAACHMPVHAFILAGVRIMADTRAPPGSLASLLKHIAAAGYTCGIATQGKRKRPKRVLSHFGRRRVNSKWLSACTTC